MVGDVSAPAGAQGRCEDEISAPGLSRYAEWCGWPAWECADREACLMRCEESDLAACVHPGVRGRRVETIRMRGALL